MSLFKLLIHSFSIIAVFKSLVFLRSFIIIIILAFLNLFIGNFTIILQILIIIFNLAIFYVSKREIEKDLIKSHKNLMNINKITH